MGAVGVHVDGVRGHSHGRGGGGGEPQPVYLRAHHAADVPGAALQRHLHAQRAQPLRSANGRSRHGGTPQRRRAKNQESRFHEKGRSRKGKKNNHFFMTLCNNLNDESL